MVNIVLEICKKELRTRFGSKKAVLPMLIAVGLPMFVFIPQLLETMVSSEPNGEYLILLFFLIIPVMLTTLVGINTFINEIRWKTIKSILVAPVSEGEIFIGKSLACIIVGLLGEAFISVIVLISIADLTVPILMLLFLIGPLSVIFTTFFFILGVSRFPAIAENGGAVLIPMSGLMIIFFFFSILKLIGINSILQGIILSLIIMILTFGAYYLAKKSFNRENLVLSV